MQFWNIFNAKAFRTKGSAFHGFFSKAIPKGFMFTLLIIFVGQILIVTFGGEMFNVVPLQIGDWLRIVLSSSVILWAGEVERLAKRMLKRK